MDATPETDGTSAVLIWNSTAPAPEGDGRLADVADAPAGVSWDLCYTFPTLHASSPGAVPPAVRGNRYLIAAPPIGTEPGKPGIGPQAYFFPQTPVTADGLWFDLTLISGTAEGATIQFFETDLVCGVKRDLVSGPISRRSASGSRGVLTSTRMSLCRPSVFVSTRGKACWDSTRSVSASAGNTVHHAPALGLFPRTVSLRFVSSSKRLK
jgi:hypothetical protein